MFNSFYLKNLVITKKIGRSIIVFKEKIIGIMKIREKIDGDRGQEIEILDKDLKVMKKREIRKRLLWKRISNSIWNTSKYNNLINIFVLIALAIKGNLDMNFLNLKSSQMAAWNMSTIVSINQTKIFEKKFMLII